jgi:hypothetical protein
MNNHFLSVYLKQISNKTGQKRAFFRVLPKKFILIINYLSILKYGYQNFIVRTLICNYLITNYILSYFRKTQTKLKQNH